MTMMMIATTATTRTTIPPPRLRRHRTATAMTTTQRKRSRSEAPADADEVIIDTAPTALGGQAIARDDEPTAAADDPPGAAAGTITMTETVPPVVVPSVPRDPRATRGMPTEMTNMITTIMMMRTTTPDEADDEDPSRQDARSMMRRNPAVDVVAVADADEPSPTEVIETTMTGALLPTVAAAATTSTAADRRRSPHASHSTRSSQPRMMLHSKTVARTTPSTLARPPPKTRPAYQRQPQNTAATIVI